jgi:signal transduction histidine kinase/DNA-binding response OmpR family regulator
MKLPAKAGIGPMTGLPAWLVASACFAVTALLEALDYATGDDVVLTLFYLIPISVATWFVRLRIGILLSFIASATSGGAAFVASLAGHTKLLHPQTLFWNGFFEFVIFAAFAVTLSALRTHLSEEKRTQQELLESRRAAEDASRLKSEFLASMSHEIRTPMNGVLGMTGVLLDTTLTTDQREFAETIRRSAESLLAIINDILDFSKIESGKLTLEMAPFDLCAVIEDVAELLAAKTREKRLDLVVHYAPATPRRVIGDEGRVRQIVTNLAGNALKFTSEGHVLVEVTAAPSDRAGLILFHVRVEDTGIGIRAEQVDHLFDRFTQADASTTRQYGGTGLGLAICKQLVQLMGGVIGAAPRPGGGSVFHFTLPLPFEAQPATAHAIPEDLGQIRCLIVDDHEVNRRVLGSQLTSWGLRSAAANSGAEALAMLRTAAGEGDPYGAVLLDFLMPGMDGIGVARAIRADAALRETPVIVLSSVERRAVPEASEVPAPFHEWLVKPVRQSRLMDVLIAAWNARRGKGTAADTAPPPSVPPSEAPAFPKTRVLVVDDGAVNQRVAALQLGKLGCRVDVAANGREGVRMVSEFPYDIVFMDCQMPELDGYDATREIRDLEAGGKHVPIVAMTAHAMTGEREKCLSAGMDDYVAKPVRPADLEAALKRWVGEKVGSADVGGSAAGKPSA